MGYIQQESFGMYVICAPSLKDQRPLLLSYWASWWDTKEDFHHFLPVTTETQLKFPAPEDALAYLRATPWHPEDVSDGDLSKAWVMPEEVLVALVPVSN